MKKAVIIVTVIIIGGSALSLYAQMENLHGDERYSYGAIHSGNQIRVGILNDGFLGRRTPYSSTYTGEWPVNSGRRYLSKMVVFIGAEVKDVNGAMRHIVSEGNGTVAGSASNASSGDSGPIGEWWTNCPLPGFANDKVQEIAMSHKRHTFPATWPDKFEDVTDPGWPGAWNGYFGKDILNADQESYYVMDDYNNREFQFYPDENDSLRRGLGLRTTVRGFQWSNVCVEDILFLLYDIKNIGTYYHDKINFCLMSGPQIGTASVSDGSDDGGVYLLDEDLGYHYDADNVGGGGWSPVGYLGLAFFESPGNSYDGIDNDGDGDMGSGRIITESMFKPIVYDVGDEVVLIDYKSFEREVVEMPDSGVSVEYLQRIYEFLPGEQLKEIPNNLIDDNLNGIIDENNGYVYGSGATAIKNYLYVGLKSIDYITGEGLDNILIEERRDDNIDNDNDWNVLFDDVGLDGKARTHDTGEGDGFPTSGAGTDLPGEPHIDKTDIDESDMIGLTAFNIHTPWSLYPLSDDEGLWRGTLPGYLNATGQIGDTDILLGSGYVPLIPGQIERFSVGIIFGYGDELFRNKKYGKEIYDKNYNFAKAPYPPNVKAIAGDNRVTLIWDEFAEESLDPILGYDFEGYRIYRSTDPGFNDMIPITDGYGSVAMRYPLAQFDLKNDIRGFSRVDVNGIKFYLGDDTGIVHSFVDSNVVNGQLYYYAVTSFDRGSDSLGIPPAECSKYIEIDANGIVDKGTNVITARPEAPSAGFVDANFDSSTIKRLSGNTASGSISYVIRDPNELKDGHVYRITFEESVTGYYRIPVTLNYSLTDITSGDVLIDKSTDFKDGDETPILDGFILTFHDNPGYLGWDPEKSGWSRDGIYPPAFQIFSSRTQPVEFTLGDFQLIIGEVGIDTSTYFLRGREELPAIPVNFTIMNTLYDKEVKFAFRELDVLENQEGMFTSRTQSTILRDQIILLTDDSLHASWEVSFSGLATYDTLQPQPGDTLEIYMNRPYLSHDIFEFTTYSKKIDQELAKAQLDKIRVVPNPYIVANSWEPQNPYINGRGPRELHFTHLPNKCTIKIFNVRGQLVDEIHRDTPNISDGTEIWNMQSKDLLDISYGVYIYHVDAGEIGEKVGKFAIIK